MKTFPLILAIVGACFVLYAVAKLARSGRARDQSLGCSFTFLAAIIWGLAFTLQLASIWDGTRLGFGLALVLPALAALAHPRRKNLVGALVLLGVALILAGPVIPKAIDNWTPTERAKIVKDLEHVQKDLEQRIEKTENYLDELRSDADDLSARVIDTGYADFDELIEDAAALRTLQELHEVKLLQAQAKKRLAAYRDSLDDVESAIRRAKRLVRARKALDQDARLPDAGAIRAEINETSRELGPITVEERIDRETLRGLFEEIITEPL